MRFSSPSGCLLFILWCLLSLTLAACSDNSSEPEKIVYSGITMTNEVGDMISLDPDDWCYEPAPTAYRDAPTGIAKQILPSKFTFGPAYPNPFNGSTTITVALPIATSVLVTIHDGGTFLDTLVEDSFAAGVQTFEWNATGLTTGIYRVFVETPEWSCYGDLDVRP